MADTATSSAVAPTSNKGIENPNLEVGVEGVNPRTDDTVESPEVQALGETGDVIATEPLRSIHENHFSAWDFPSSLTSEDLVSIW